MENFVLEENGRTVTVAVSPRSRDMLLTDAAFWAQIYQEAINVSEEVPQETPSTSGRLEAMFHNGSANCEVLENEPFADPCGSKICWLEKDVKLLIELYKDLHGSLGKVPKCKTKSKMFREISIRMTEHGCSYSPIQVEIKWRSLEKKYKKTSNTTAKPVEIERTSSLRVNLGKF